MDQSDQISEWLEEFCAVAVRKGEEGVATDEDHRLFTRMGEIVNALRSADASAMEAFGVLLRHHSDQVQLWVASVLLAQGDNDAKRVLEQLARQRGVVGLNASVVLDEFAAGRFASPFPP